MISAGQTQPAASGSASAKPSGNTPPPGDQPSSTPVTGTVLPPIAGMPENGCMYNRGNDKIDENDKSANPPTVSSYSVAGLTPYALRTAALLDSSVDAKYMDYMYAVYQPDQFVIANKGSHFAVIQNEAASRVGMNRVCALDNSSVFDGVDGYAQINWGSLEQRGAIGFDSAAANWVSDLCGDDEHQPEQIALLKAMRGFGMEDWNNRLVHYLGAFGDGVFGTYMAQAFREDGVKDYVAKVREGLKTANQMDNGVMVLLGVFAPLTMNKASVLGALNLIGKATKQEEFAKVVGAGYDFNVARDRYKKVTTFMEAHQADMQIYEALKMKAYMDEMSGKTPRMPIPPNSDENAKNAKEGLDAIKLMEDSLKSVKVNQLTDDQREFKLVMLEWAESAKNVLKLFTAPPPLDCKKTPNDPRCPKPRVPGPGPGPKPPGPKTVDIPDPFTMLDVSKDYKLA
ncbi:MAG: hypothetical protein WC690_07845 [bacterium]